MSHLDEHSDTQSLLRAYFRELDAALAGLPRDRRKALAAEIRQHVDQLLTEQPPRSPAELRNLLDRVGQPADIAEAALAEEPEQPRRSMGRGQLAVLAGVGVIALAGLGIGLALALTSSHAPNGSPAAASTPTASHATTAPAAPSATAPATPSATASGTPASSAQSTPASTPPTSAPATPTATGTGANPLRAILAPATVPPASDECAKQVVYDADGNVSPLLCPNGGVNTIAWNHYAYNQRGTTNKSELLRLGPFASPTQVYQAMCYDYGNVYGTRPLTMSAEQLANGYYGWRFAGDNPLQDFEVLGCPTPKPKPAPAKS